jgi:hypothetical protein
LLEHFETGGIVNLDRNERTSAAYEIYDLADEGRQKKYTDSSSSKEVDRQL